MHRLASQLASIKISLDPPSPPHTSTTTLAHCFNRNQSSLDPNYLHVPTEYDAQQLSSPPPDRRCSLTSLTSDDSVTISMSSSCQPLLSPMCASKKFCIEDCDIPSNELMEQLRNAQGHSPCSETICVPPVLLSPVLLRPVRSAQSATSPLPTHSNTMTFHGSDSENSDSAPWRGSGGSVSVPRRSLASGSRSSTPVMSPIMNRSSSGSRLGAFHLMSRSGSGSGLLSGRSLLQRTDSNSESDRRRKRLRRRTMIYGISKCFAIGASMDKKSLTE